MAAIALRFSKSCCFAFNDKLAYFDLVCDKNAVNIVCKLYSFTIADNVCRIVEDRLEPSEINVARGLISPNHCEVSILAFKTVKFAETQLEFPVVLIKKEYFGPKKDIELMLVGLIASDCGLYLTSIGPLLKLETPCASGIFLSNGPSIFWMSQGELSVNLINLVKNTFTKWKFPISDAQIGCRIIDLGANFIWDEELRGCIAIVLWNESLARFLEITFSTTSNVVNIKRNKKFDEQSVAYRYLKVCTSACFQKVRDRCDTMNFFVTTSNKQMMSINFELMAIKFYTIPFDDSNSIQFYRNRHKLEDYCLLTSASGQSCIMDLDKSKIIENYSTPFDLHIGHFLLLEDLQVLFMKAEPGDLEKPVSQRFFEITNFRNKYSSVPQQKEISQGLITAHHALETRLLAGKCAVSNAESDLSHLTGTLKDIALTLSSLSIGEEPSCKEHQGYVLGFLNGKHHPVEHKLTEAMKNHSCKIIDISRPWHKIMDGHLIIGVDITNCSNVDLWDFRLVVTSPSQELQHSSKFFEPLAKSSTTDDTLSPQMKRLCTREKSANKEDVGMVHTPNLLMPCNSGFLTTTLYTKIFGHRERVIFNILVLFQRIKSQQATQCCIGAAPYTLSINDILKDENTINFQKSDEFKDLSRNLAALNSITDTFNVTLISKHTNLSNITEYLQEKLNFNYNERLLVFYWEEPSFGFLKNAWISVISNSSSTEVKLSIHARNRDQFFKLIHHFYHQFPEDVLILPMTDNLKPSLSTCLVREADFVSQFLESIESKFSSSCDVKQFKTVEEARQAYEYQKKAFQELPNRRINIDLKKYKIFRQQLFNMEDETDRMFLSKRQ